MEIKNLNIIIKSISLRRTGILSLFFLIFLEGCSVDYEEADISDTFLETTPNSIIFNFSQSVITEGKLSYSIEADKAEIYDKSKKTSFSNVLFTEYGNDGEKTTEGAAEKALYFSENDDILFSGGLIINSISEGFIVRSEYMEWNNKNKILKSKDDTQVSVEQENGTFIEGRGFIADAENKSFTFLQNAKGRYFSEDDD